MKIDANQIPFEGLNFSEDIPIAELDLETDIIKLVCPVKVRAEVSRITNAVTVHLLIEVKMQSICSRCLNEFPNEFTKRINLNYSVDKLTSVIDLNPDIREELMLDFPIKPLCKPDCLGLCLKCGKNLNEEKCNCKSN